MLTTVGKSQGTNLVQCDKGGGRVLLPAPPMVKLQGGFSSCLLPPRSPRGRQRGLEKSRVPTLGTPAEFQAGSLLTKQSQSWRALQGLGV